MFSRNAAIDGMRRSSNACAMAARSRRNIGPAGKMIGCPLGILHRAKCVSVALLAFDFDRSRLQAQLAGRLGGSIALLARKRVESDSDEGRARERLAGDFNAFGGELELADEDAGHIAAGM